MFSLHLKMYKFLLYLKSENFFGLLAHHILDKFLHFIFIIESYMYQNEWLFNTSIGMILINDAFNHKYDEGAKFILKVKI